MSKLRGQPSLSQLGQTPLASQRVRRMLFPSLLPAAFQFLAFAGQSVPGAEEVPCGPLRLRFVQAPEAAFRLGPGAQPRDLRRTCVAAARASVLGPAGFLSRF